MSTHYEGQGREGWSIVEKVRQGVDEAELIGHIMDVIKRTFQRGREVHHRDLKRMLTVEEKRWRETANQQLSTGLTTSMRFGALAEARANELSSAVYALEERLK